MVGDTIIINDKDRQFGKSVTEILLPKINKSQKRIITIGGPSGSHKTERAHTLRKELKKWGFTSKILSQDDIYRVGPVNRRIYRELHGLDVVGRYELDWNLVDVIVNDFRMGFPIWMPQYDADCQHYEWLNWNPVNVDFLIVEGIYACFLEPMTGIKPSFSIFLDLTPEQTLAFRRLRNKENEYDEFRQQIVKKEYEECLQSKEFCNIIVDFEGIIDYSKLD